MSVLTFDTLKLSRRLEASGFTREQATGAAEALAEVGQEQFSELATKSFLAGELEKLELRMVIKLGTMQLASIGIFLAAVKYLGH